MTNPSTTQETRELEPKRSYYDDLPITTIAEADKFCNCPPHDQLKCNRCARTIPYTKDTPYSEVADCDTFGCGGQMMGTDWAGWYNHWRDLARDLLNRNAALADEVTRLREALERVAKEQHSDTCSAELVRGLVLDCDCHVSIARAVLQPKAEGEHQ